MSVERTLIVFKPDAVQRGLIGEIIARFERVGLKLVGLKMITPNQEQLHNHYEGIGTIKSRRGDEVYRVTMASMMESPVVAGVLEGIHAVNLVRKMVGSTEPQSAAPGTIRGDYAHTSFTYANSDGESKTLPNIIHASASTEEAQAEVALWFEERELFHYETTHEKAVRGRVPK